MRHEKKSSLRNRIIFLLVLVLFASGCAKANDGASVTSLSGSAAEGDAADGETMTDGGEVASAPLEERGQLEVRF